MTPHLGLPEGIVIGLFVVLALRAMAVPSSLLSQRDFDEMVSVYPTLVEERAPFEIRTKNGTARVQSVAPYGCIRIEAADGQRVGPICNRHMDCWQGARPTLTSNLTVFRTSTSGEYFADTGSTCDSSCCDLSGMRFSANGRRLDDGPLQRVYLRLGSLGLAALAVGVSGATLRLLRRRWLGWRITTLLGFASAVLLLWREL